MSCIASVENEGPYNLERLVVQSNGLTQKSAEDEKKISKLLFSFSHFLSSST